MSRLATPFSALAILGASLALVACGSSDDTSAGGAASVSKTTTNGAGGTQSAAFQKYQQCLKDNGVTLPQRGQGGGGGYGGGPGAGAPGGGQPPSGTTPPSGDGTPPTGTNGAPPAGGFGGRANDPKFQKAMQACAKLRPQGAGGFRGNGQRPQQDIKAFTPYLNCLKGKGLDVKVSDGFNALRSLKQDDPKVQAALKACQSKIPQRPGSASGTTPGSTATPGSTT